MDIKELELTEEERNEVEDKFYHEDGAVGYVRDAHPGWLAERMAQAQLNKVLSHPRLCWKAENQELGSVISYLLGLHGQFKLYENYPDNFNRIMKLIEIDMLKSGVVKVEEFHMTPLEIAEENHD